MKHHRCFCHYIPPHVLRRLLVGGVVAPNLRENVRLSAIQAKASRLKRAGKIRTTQSGASSTAERFVYDCENTWTMRRKLVRQEGGAVTGDAAVDTVYESVGIVRDYFRALGRNSIDDQGMEFILNVHYRQSYTNAFWDGDEMTFGDGDGQTFANLTHSLDVVAHEIAHGVTQHTADLDYYSQSGALNEHFSDIFGSAIQQYHNRQDAGQADWLIGNEIMGPTLFGEALRSMKAPGAAYDNPLMGNDPQPSHMRDYYAGSDDKQGVHINSGIPNRAFFLVASDIGTDKAVAIWYHALRMLWPDAKFNDAAEVIAEAARHLTKTNAVPLGSTQLVRLAFQEVGLL